MVHSFVVSHRNPNSGKTPVIVKGQGMEGGRRKKQFGQSARKQRGTRMGQRIRVHNFTSLKGFRHSKAGRMGPRLRRANGGVCHEKKDGCAEEAIDGTFSRGIRAVEQLPNGGTKSPGWKRIGGG